MLRRSSTAARPDSHHHLAHLCSQHTTTLADGQEPDAGQALVRRLCAWQPTTQLLLSASTTTALAWEKRNPKPDWSTQLLDRVCYLLPQ